MVFSQNKVSKTVADISVSGTKLHVSYSDGTSKDMDMPPATSLQLPIVDTGHFHDHTGQYMTIYAWVKSGGENAAGLGGKFQDGSRYRDFHLTSVRY